MQKILRWLFTRQLVARDRDCAEAMRMVLRNKCPLCAGGLSEHTHAVVASFLLGTEIVSREQARERVLRGEIGEVHSSGANQPDFDVVYYALLHCPQVQDDVVIEHFSGADLYSEESATPVPDVPKTRRVWLAARAVESTVL